MVFVAGGIGLAPLRPAILEVCANRGEYDRVAVLYGARTPEDILFADDLRSWHEDHDLAVEVIVDSGRHAWRGERRSRHPAHRARPVRRCAHPGPDLRTRGDDAALGGGPR